eukprot:5364139-Pyramimonas_sp.AAC.2
MAGDPSGLCLANVECCSHTALKFVQSQVGKEWHASSKAVDLLANTHAHLAKWATELKGRPEGDHVRAPPNPLLSLLLL